MKNNKEVENPKDAFVDYVNNITDKAEKYTAEKLEKLEKKAKETLDSTKASVASQARTLNHIADKKVSELKSTVDTILFE